MSPVPPDQAAVSPALDDVVVLDLGQAFMGPYCGLLMQRLGADVIKVEPPSGEPYRRPTPIKGVEAVQFSLLNAGKRSLCIDLKQPQGRELFLDLATRADVVIQNYAPGAFERLVGIDELLERNSRLIVASGSGYGSTGPYSPMSAMDLTIQAMSGVMSTTGFEDGVPVRTGPSVVDFMGGTHLFGAIMAALVQRVKTGRGQRVEVALYDAILPALASNIGGYFDSDGETPERTGNRHGGLATSPYNAYRTADGHIAILCLHDRHWRSLCSAMERPELADDPELSTNPHRCRKMDRVDDLVGSWTSSRATAELSETLNAVGVPCAPVLSLGAVLDDPQVKVRGMIERHENAEREWWTFGSPIRLGDSPSPTDNVPAKLGEHTDEILTEKLSLSTAELDELSSARVIIRRGDAGPPAGGEAILASLGPADPG
ncbi:MAG: CaiB/BaiF CoA transferase family protein [Solirubrobacteraceae bacterium]